MNYIDIIIIAILLYALYSGFKDGLVIQVCSLLAVAVGIWLGSNYGEQAANMVGINGHYSAVWGMLIVVVLTVIVIKVGALLTHKLLKFAGFGLVDLILGATLALVKTLLIMSVLFSIFDIFNDSFKVLSRDTIAGSSLYRPITNLTKWVTPAWDWTQRQFSNIEELDVEIPNIPILDGKK